MDIQVSSNSLQQIEPKRDNYDIVSRESQAQNNPGVVQVEIKDGNWHGAVLFAQNKVNAPDRTVKTVASSSKAPSDEIKKMLDDPDLQVRSAGYKLLIRCGDNPEVTELLINKGIRDKSPDIRLNSAFSVIQIVGQAKGCEILSGVAKDAKLTIPLRNVAILGMQRGGTNAIVYLTSLLEDSEGAIKFRTLETLELLKKQGVDISAASPKISELAEKEKYQEAKRVAMRLYSGL